MPYSLGSRPRFVLERIERRRHQGAGLPAPLRRARQVHRGAAQAPRRGRVRPGGARPLVQHPQHAGGLAEDRAAARQRDTGELARRRRGPGEVAAAAGDDDAGTPPVPGRRRAAPGALALHRPLRRADGAPRGAAVAQPRRAAARHQAQRARRHRDVLVVRVRGQRRRVDRRAPGHAGLRRPAGHRHRGGHRAGQLRGRHARHAGRGQAVGAARTSCPAWPPSCPGRAGCSSWWPGGCPPLEASSLVASHRSGTPALALLLAVSDLGPAGQAGRPGRDGRPRPRADRGRLAGGHGAGRHPLAAAWRAAAQALPATRSSPADEQPLRPGGVW